MYREIKLRMIAIFSSEIIQTKRQWDNTFNIVLKGKKETCHLKILYLVKCFKKWKKCFRQTKAKRIIASQTEIQEILKEVIQEERK